MSYHMKEAIVFVALTCVGVFGIIVSFAAATFIAGKILGFQ